MDRSGLRVATRREFVKEAMLGAATAALGLAPTAAHAEARARRPACRLALPPRAEAAAQGVIVG
jgi:hypothetical protein